jgi:hypothetical protein
MKLRMNWYATIMLLGAPTLPKALPPFLSSGVSNVRYQGNIVTYEFAPSEQAHQSLYQRISQAAGCVFSTWPAGRRAMWGYPELYGQPHGGISNPFWVPAGDIPVSRHVGLSQLSCTGNASMAHVRLQRKFSRQEI